ncbi:ATP-dependent RNA helicase HrpA [Crateriforma conspicua]|uniref:ATP-dependent RNA helicase HrpA n=1 Tax=Crateriforma conspicua TaxID=2527996 RepID=UPI00118A7B8B|nr:ATP-dependent RNA helicase HrpA [Crateriforma conspicua]QDV61390.1 ATP-dependent RNA helicase HrpB [Crateriforma conspicua]
MTFKPESPKLGAAKTAEPNDDAPEVRRDLGSIRLETPDELPIAQYRGQIIELLQSRQVIVVCGETGSGKSTQLPKFCVEAGLGQRGRIGHTQPRRLAARSIADRLSEELGAQIGKQVGYQIRFGDKTSDETIIKLMTDGILLAETQSDRQLRQYEAIIIDEAHERSLNIDFLLGYLRRLIDRRDDLKLIITSATIDADRFAQHFADADGPAPILNVQGRGYPVEIRYLPWEQVNEDDANQDLGQHVIAALEMLSRSGGGDTLVFLPTERDIREVSHQVAGHYRRLGLAQRYDLLPLYARLPAAQQQQIFHPSGAKRRVIFATNVAESSLTVPGIHFVIDSGTARISRYSQRTKVQRLPIEPISRASADQRAGRCGRIGPGICIRLYSEDDYDNRDAFTTPEIRRTNLASVVLKTKTLRLGNLEDFPLLDPPRPDAIRQGIRTLQELNAIDSSQELTDIGWELGRMPVDPRVGRILLAATQSSVLPEVLPIVAAMEIQDPRERPPEKRQAADECHAQFADPQSDFLADLRLWKQFGQWRDDLSRNQLQRTLRKNFLSPSRMREWADVYRQLREMALTLQKRQSNRSSVGKIRWDDHPDRVIDEDRSVGVHQTLLSGLLSGVAKVGDKNEYTGAGNLKLFLWPGSHVFDAKPKWIMAAELVETSRQYARMVARIQPGWIEQVGAHLLKHSYSDPHWSQKSNGAFCYQQSTLFGLPIVVRRRVPLPPIDRSTARDLLIRNGLVDGELTTNASFVRHNRRLCDAIEVLAAKTRRRDLVVDPFAVQSFYARVLPDDVCDRGRLEKHDRLMVPPQWASQLKNSEDVSRWLQQEPPADPDHETVQQCPTPYMRVSDLVQSESELITQQDFPDQLQVGATTLPLTYRFLPGDQRDGVAVRVHQDALPQISDDRLGWLVPGLLQPKLIAMIKSLPKRIRRNLVPAADIAKQVADELMPVYGQTPFMTAVCQAFSQHAEMPVQPTDFQAEKLDGYLDFLVEVVDDDGKPIASDRSADRLQRQISPRAASPQAAVESEQESDWSRKSMTVFDIEQLPVEVIRRRGGVHVAQYPAVVDRGDHAATGVYPDRQTAMRQHAGGLVRLYALAERKEIRSQVRWLPALEDAKLRLGSLISADQMESQLTDLIARVAFVESQPEIRSQAEFEARRRDRGERIGRATQQVAPWLATLSEAYFEIRRELESAPTNQQAMLDDVRDQLRWLAPERFMAIIPWAHLQHYPRYFRAIAYRIDKNRSGAAARDDEGRKIVSDLWDRWLQTLPPEHQQADLHVDNEFRWMIEELRVSLFAQPLGTATKISPQRCDKWLRKTSA